MKQGIKLLVLSCLICILPNAHADNEIIFNNSFEFLEFGTLRFITPDDDQIIDQQDITVRIRASITSEQPTQVLINDLAAVLVAQTASYKDYEIQLSLTEGVNTINAQANYGDDGVSINNEVQFIALNKITITSPTDWQTLGPIQGSGNSSGNSTNQTGTVERPVNITGNLSSNSIIDVQINQQQADINGSTFSFADFFLHEGSNLINVVATDQYDRQSNAQITVYVDQSAPLLTVTGVNGRITSNNRIDITGFVNDAMGADFNAASTSVTINNTATGLNTTAQVLGSNYLAQDIPLAVGNNSLIITATDGLGNSRDIQTNIIRIAVGTDRITRFSGNNQSNQANNQLPSPLTIVAMDKAGLPLVDLPIHFDISKGDGSINNDPNQTSLSDGIYPARNLIINTDTTGQAQVWLTLGTQAGLANNIIQVSTQSTSQNIYFYASTLTGEPAKILIEGASGTQYAQTNSQPVEALTAMVLDENNNPVATTPVIYTITQGDAEFDLQSALGAELLNNGQSIRTLTDNKGQSSARPRMGTTKSNVKIIAQAELEDNTTIGQTTFNIIVLKRTDNPTSFAGITMDHSGIPIQGIQFSIARTNLTALSDENGRFTFPNNVPTGKIDLFVDGRNVQVIQNGETIEYPALHFETAIIQGQNNQLPHPVYLPPVHIENTKTVGGNQDVTLTIPGFQGFKMIVKANSVTFPDGSNQGELVVNPVHNDRLPMVPPGTGGRFMATGWTLQPTGTRFDPPIEVHIPNTDGLKPGTTVPIVQWDHDMAYFVPMGQGTISEDGSVLVTNPGSGITKAGWGGGPPPIPPNEAENDNECKDLKNNNKATSLTISANGVTGELLMDHVKDGTNVLFKATIGGSCEAPAYSWNFGDRNSSQQESPTHKYTGSGEYNVDLEVSCQSCDPIRAAYRVGLRCKLEEIVGECIAEYGKTVSFNTDTNDSKRTEWYVEKGGDPLKYTGDLFDVIFNPIPKKTKYSTKIEASCKSKFAEEEDITIEKVIDTAFTCSKYEPLDKEETKLDESLLSNSQGNLGLFKIELEGPFIRGCTTPSNKWNFRLETDASRYDIEYLFDKIVINTPYDKDHRGKYIYRDNTCKKILRDFTPRVPRYGTLTPRNRYYINTNIIKAHEMFHLDDANNRVVDVLYDGLLNIVAPQISLMESECKVDNPNNIVINFWEPEAERLMTEYDANKEQRAYDLKENPMLQIFIETLRNRARLENWSNTECH